MSVNASNVLSVSIIHPLSRFFSDLRVIGQNEEARMLLVYVVILLRYLPYLRDRFSNSVCDEVCMREECEFDGGDCFSEMDTVVQLSIDRY